MAVSGRVPGLQSGGCRFESRPGSFAPRSTQPSILPEAVNEYQLWLGRQRQVWLILLANETQGVQMKLCYPLTMHAIPECLRDASCGGAIQIDCLYLYIYHSKTPGELGHQIIHIHDSLHWVHNPLSHHGSTLDQKASGISTRVPVTTTPPR